MARGSEAHQWFSGGSDALLKRLTPYSKAGMASFPALGKVGTLRRKQGQDAHAWFVQCVDSICAGEPKGCLVEDDLAVFAVVKWSANKLLTFANVQVLKVGCSLEDFYMGEAAQHHYLRLDLDHKSLGPLFSHPLPHIHVCAEGPPRFALDNSFSGNTVVDFLDLVYRQFYSEKWIVWAERVWNEKYHETSRNDEDNPFRIIREAFDGNQIDILRDHMATVERLKKVLQEAKEKLPFRLEMDDSDRQLFAYP